MFPPTMNLSTSWYCHLNTQQTAHLSDDAAYKYKHNSYDVATLKNKMTCLFHSNLYPKQQLFSVTFGLIVLKKVKKQNKMKQICSTLPCYLI